MKQIGDMKQGLGGSRPQLSILPRAGLIIGGRALEYGAAKYARGNYHGPAPKKLGDDAEAKRLLGYIDAAMRHLAHVADAVNRALGTGGDVRAACAVIDDEASGNFPASGLPHLSHAIASLLLGASCAADDGLLPADPGQPWTLTATAQAETLEQKNDPAAERARVADLARIAKAQAEIEARRQAAEITAIARLGEGRIPGPMPRPIDTGDRKTFPATGGLAADLTPGESDMLAPTNDRTYP